MVQPVGDNVNPPIAPAGDFTRQRNPFHQQDAAPPSVQVSLSPEVRERQGFEGDHPLTVALRNEFRQVFELSRDQADPFRGDLDRILQQNGLTA